MTKGLLRFGCSSRLMENLPLVLQVHKLYVKKKVYSMIISQLLLTPIYFPYCFFTPFNKCKYSLIVKFYRLHFHPVSDSSFFLCIIGEMLSLKLSLRGPNEWKWDGARSEEYGECAVLQAKKTDDLADLTAVV